MKNQKTMGNKGFSLVELIVVIAIMAVLVGVLAPQFIKYVENSRQSTDVQNVQELKTAVEVYVADNEVSSNVTITIGSNKATVGGGITNLGTTANEVALKSTGWAGSTYTYDVSTYKWSGKTASGSVIDGNTVKDVNSKGKNTDMYSVFK